MRYLLLILCLLCVPAVAQDDQSDLPPELQTVDVPEGFSSSGMGDPQVDARLEALEDWVRRTTDYLKRDQAGEEDRVREIVQDELRKAQLSVRTPEGTVVQRSVTQVEGYTGTFDLAPGEVLVAVNGQPVNRSTYQTVAKGPVVRYVNQGFDVRAYQAPRSGRIRHWIQGRQATSCQIVNGQMICN